MLFYMQNDSVIITKYMYTLMTLLAHLVRMIGCKNEPAPEFVEDNI